MPNRVKLLACNIYIVRHWNLFFGHGANRISRNVSRVYCTQVYCAECDLKRLGYDERWAIKPMHSYGISNGFISNGFHSVLASFCWFHSVGFILLASSVGFIWFLFVFSWRVSRLYSVHRYIQSTAYSGVSYAVLSLPFYCGIIVIFRACPSRRLQLTASSVDNSTKRSTDAAAGILLQASAH